MKEFKYLSNKKKERINLFKSNEEDNELKLSNTFRTEIAANGSLITEGCQGVVDYTDYYVKIKVKKGYMVVSGSNLNICYYEDKTIKINGKIESIEFSV